MKALRLLGLWTVMALALSFTACSDDDDKLDGISQQELMGVWIVAPMDKNATMTDASVWTFIEDNTCTCLLGERGTTLSFTYQLVNHGHIVQLTTNEGNLISFSTGRLSKDEILWQEMPEAGSIQPMHKLCRYYAE